MAQNYGVDIQRWNGQDYDTILPTPDAHASTHQANGSDSLILQEGNYGDSSIPTSAYQDASVTRAKLATDALYSPIVAVSSSRNITKDDIGKTLRTAGSSDITFTLSQEFSDDMPNGSEIAILRWTNAKCRVFFNDVAVAMSGDTKAKTHLTVEPSSKYDMIAIKKMFVDSGTDYWLLTGAVEVVS